MCFDAVCTCVGAWLRYTSSLRHLAREVMVYVDPCPPGRDPLALFVKNLGYDVPKERLRQVFQWHGANGIQWGEVRMMLKHH